MIRIRPILLALVAGIPGSLQAQNLISPVHGYLSVEPFELRKEFVMRFDTIAERVGRGSVTDIQANHRAAVEQRIGEWLTGKCPVEADGKPLVFELDRVHFVRPDAEKGLVVDERESIPSSEALVGVVFSIGWKAPPAELKVTWEVFPADGSEAVVEVGTRDHRAARKLTPENAELTWKNEGVAMPELLAVPEIVADTAGFLRRLPIVGLVAGVVLILAGLTSRRAGMAAFLSGVVVTGLALLTLPLAFSGGSGKGKVTSQQADEICYALLRNIYHAFDYRTESDVYDTLALSTTGDLLEQIYLEVRRSLQLETQGGARVRVTDVDLRRCDLGAAGGKFEGFSADCEWVAVGTVTHWGHTHDRINRYRARMTVAPVGDRWRLTGLALESEERVDQEIR